MKFFPIYEGGCLVSRRQSLDVQLHSAGVGFEAKASLATLEAAFAYGRMALLRLALYVPLRVKSLIWGVLKSRARQSGAMQALATSSLAPSSSDSSFTFDSRWADKRSSWFSRSIMRLASHARIVERRRQNYIALHETISGLPGCRPLFALLPEGACPWIFPIVAEQPEALFEALSAAHVPMVRFGATLWPGVDASICANSIELGRTLIGVPCHQELQAAELTWLIDTIRRAVHVTTTVPT